MRLTPAILIVTLFLCAGCTTTQGTPARPVLTVDVPAWRETDTVQTLEDAADDPAIWRNAGNPAKSLIVATDKKLGLGVYGLDGKRRSMLPAGLVNNVDLRSGVIVAGKRAILVGASDRTIKGDGRLALLTLDPRTATLTPLVRVPITEMNEPYGFCLYRGRAGLFGFVVGKDGLILQLKIDVAGPTPTATIVRRMKLATQSEGCVADDRTGLLYVNEEDAGLWRFDAAPTAPTTPVKLANADGERLVADAEGVAIAAEGQRGGYLIASSQGDSAYTVWRLPDHAYLGRFRIVPNGAIGGTSETDGIEVSAASFGRGLEGGIMIAQDGDNTPNAQNFKLVRWADVKRALRLR